MEYRRLGKSGLKVSTLSFGSWVTFGYQINEDVSEKLMITAYEHGVNFFDNAEIYADGRSEVVMGKIFKKLGWDRTSFVVSSKAFFGDGRKGPNQTGLSRKHLFEACNDALKRLQVDYLDLFFCHRPDRNTPIEETVWTMHNLIQQGKILYWGTSEWSAQEITQAHYVAAKNNLIGPLMEQPQYNMFHRQKIEVDFLQLYRDFGLGTTTWSPLASGLLTGKYNAGNIQENTRLQLTDMAWLKDKTLTEGKLGKVAALGKIASDLGISLARLGVAWCAKNPNVSTVILGASKVEQLTETLMAIDDVKLLTNEVLEKIEGVLQNKPELSIW